MTNKIKQTFNQIILNRKHLGVEFNGKEFLNTDIGLNKVASILDSGTDIILLNNNFNNDKTFLDTAIKIKQLCNLHLLQTFQLLLCCIQLFVKML